MNTDIQQWDNLKDWAWAKQLNDDAIREELDWLNIVEHDLKIAKDRFLRLLDFQEKSLSTVKHTVREIYHSASLALWPLQGNAESAVEKNLAFRRRIEAEFRARTHEPPRDLAAFREEIKKEIDAQIKAARDLKKQLDSGDSQDWSQTLIELRDQSKSLAYHITQLIELTNSQGKEAAE